MKLVKGLTEHLRAWTQSEHSFRLTLLSLWCDKEEQNPRMQNNIPF